MNSYLAELPVDVLFFLAGYLPPKELDVLTASNPVINYRLYLSQRAAHYLLVKKYTGRKDWLQSYRGNYKLALRYLDDLFEALDDDDQRIVTIVRFGLEVLYPTIVKEDNVKVLTRLALQFGNLDILKLTVSAFPDKVTVMNDEVKKAGFYLISNEMYSFLAATFDIGSNITLLQHSNRLYYDQPVEGTISIDTEIVLSKIAARTGAIKQLSQYIKDGSSTYLHNAIATQQLTIISYCLLRIYRNIDLITATQSDIITPVIAKALGPRIELSDLDRRLNYHSNTVNQHCTLAALIPFLLPRLPAYEVSTLIRKLLTKKMDLAFLYTFKAFLNADYVTQPTYRNYLSNVFNNITIVDSNLQAVYFVYVKYYYLLNRVPDQPFRIRQIGITTTPRLLYFPLTKTITYAVSKFNNSEILTGITDIEWLKRQLQLS